MRTMLMGCNLQPIINMAQALGVQSLNQKINGDRLTVGQEIVAQSNATELVLGDVGTSPLEMAGAYAGVANEGKFNAPAPILSVTDSAGHARQVPRAPGVQVVSPQIALQAEQLLHGDTKGQGTSADPFRHLWYDKGGSDVAGKTGTAVAVDSKGNATDKNSAIWFVGMTPTRTAATVLVNLDHPNYASTGLPGVKHPGDAYGEYASQVWLETLGPVLVHQTWSWPDPNAVLGDEVPNIEGDSLADAQSRLAAAGFKLAKFGGSDGIVCPSPVTPGTIAFYGPTIAVKGSTITVCQSSGASQNTYTAPKPSNTPSSPTGSTPAGGGGHTSPPTKPTHTKHSPPPHGTPTN